ncbi:MAG: hypothetical protein V4558_16130 [Gemmatimonadota bacterium]
MSTARPGAPGATRTCPHCRATILESAAVCPSCKHHLRFDPKAAARAAAAATSTPLKVVGTITHPAGADPAEYSVVVSISNEKGEEIARQVVGVGALHPQDKRTFTLAVELFGTNS